MARTRWAFAGAAVAALAALLCLVALVRVEDGESGAERLSSLGSGLVLAVAGVTFVAALLLTLYALDGVGKALGVTAVVLLAVVGPVAAGATYYLPWLAALFGGLAVAAGDPLPPPDPGDDRMSRPMPGRRPDADAS
jgi:hypothetical protein